MARRPLFASGDTKDIAYQNIRDAKTGPLYRAKNHCEYLWIFFERHSDPEFLTEIRNNFQARYWEMFLTVSFILAGYEVKCPKPGPDVGIIYRGQRIWFEAVSPSPGNPDAPDYIQSPVMGEVSDVPNEKIILRYLNSISEKYDRQYANWIAKEHVSKDEAFVIALNPRNIPFEYADTQPPRILQAAYPLGNMFAVIDRTTMKVARTGHHFRDHIEKAAKEQPVGPESESMSARVSTGVFEDGKHDGLSALLCSRADSANLEGEFGDDFQLVPNHRAKNKLHPDFRLRGTYYAVEEDSRGKLKVTPSTR